MIDIGNVREVAARMSADKPDRKKKLQIYMFKIEKKSSPQSNSVVFTIE